MTIIEIESRLYQYDSTFFGDFATIFERMSSINSCNPFYDIYDETYQQLTVILS